MHYLISGGTGFIGTSLIESLLADGHAVTVLTRGKANGLEGCRYVTDIDALDNGCQVDAIVNLAGASLAGSRWSEPYKQEIVESRMSVTRELIGLCARLERKPEVFVSASAIGYYGPHGDEILAEDGPITACFSSHLCQQWEEAALGAEAMGIRVCLMRLGVVLDRKGGAMEQMARPFKLGVANWMGSGQQWLSWVHRRDVVRACRFLLDDSALSGAFNLTAPAPVTSRGFCDAMKAQKTTLLTMPVPAGALRLLVGEMADELLLSGQRVVPARLQQAGFEFCFPELPEALEDIV